MDAYVDKFTFIQEVNAEIKHGLNEHELDALFVHLTRGDRNDNELRVLLKGNRPGLSEMANGFDSQSFVSLMMELPAVDEMMEESRLSLPDVKDIARMATNKSENAIEEHSDIEKITEVKSESKIEDTKREEVDHTIEEVKADQKSDTE
jgi:hypothetical protein